MKKFKINNKFSNDVQIIKTLYGNDVIITEEEKNKDYYYVSSGIMDSGIISQASLLSAIKMYPTTYNYNTYGPSYVTWNLEENIYEYSLFDEFEHVYKKMGDMDFYIQSPLRKRGQVSIEECIDLIQMLQSNDINTKKLACDIIYSLLIEDYIFLQIFAKLNYLSYQDKPNIENIDIDMHDYFLSNRIIKCVVYKSVTDIIKLKHIHISNKAFDILKLIYSNRNCK